jgi:uncharacterized membrane protein
VLNAVLFWLLALPLIIMLLLDYAQRELFVIPGMQEGLVWGVTDLRPLILLTIMQIALTLVMIWGIACVLIAGKRLISSKAGRARTSFAVIRHEGRGFILNIFLTSILRSCIALLWSILLIIPGIVYFIRTMFYQVTIVCEGKDYRDALRASNDVVRGHTWTVLWYIMGLLLAIFLPVFAMIAVLENAVAIVDSRLLPALFIPEGALMAIAVLLFTLSLAALYREIKKLPTAVSPS